MTDEAYLFLEDVREKAIPARSSHNSGNSRRRKCRLSSDGMTKREWEKMNGPIRQIKLGEAMTWEAFKVLPETLQRTYIERILDKYKVGPNAIARLFGISSGYCSVKLRKLGFTFPERTAPAEIERFLTDYGQLSENAAGEIVEGPFEVAVPGRETNLERALLTFSGKFSPEAIAARLAGLFEQGCEVTITIEVLAKQ